MSRFVQQLIPHLWFDDQAEQAAQFYTSLFAGSRIGPVTRYGKEGFEIHGQLEGRVMTVGFELAGYRFIALNGGPQFTFTPTISFFVMCETAGDIDDLWRRLSDGGVALMALGRYGWSEKYGWLQDRYGLSWQLSLGTVADVGQKITPCLMYTGAQQGRAEEAIHWYTRIFNDSSITSIFRYGAGEGGQEGTVKHARFRLNGETFMAMDSGVVHAFTFNEAISLLVDCTSQEDIDYFWEKLSEGGDPQAQQCRLAQGQIRSVVAGNPDR